ncbi:hypothetical protein O6217_24075, partial [Salmonella enterica subsp. enterica]
FVRQRYPRRQPGFLCGLPRWIVVGTTVFTVLDIAVLSCGMLFTRKLTMQVVTSLILAVTITCILMVAFQSIVASEMAAYMEAGSWAR